MGATTRELEERMDCDKRAIVSIWELVVSGGIKIRTELLQDAN